MAKILYAAGTSAHLRSFHIPYIEALRAEGHEVLTMAHGDGVDFNVAFEKKMLSARNIKCQRDIRRILKEESFDAILLNTTLAAFNIRMVLPKGRRPRVVNLMHGYMFSEEPRGLKEKIFLFAEKFLRRKTDSVIVMNDEDLRSAYRYRLTYGDILKIRGMGATVPEEREPAKAIRTRLASEEKYAICFVGELSGSKNQHMLISALPPLLKSIPDAVLWLVGAGGAEEELKALARELNVSDSVKFVGFVSNPTDYVRASDIYVAPSRKEGLPFNIIEALGTAKPLAASDIKGHCDLIEDGVTGLLFDRDSQDELTDRILSVYEKRVVFDSNRQIETYKQYSFDEVFDETLGVIKKLLLGEKEQSP